MSSLSCCLSLKPPQAPFFKSRLAETTRGEGIKENMSDNQHQRPTDALTLCPLRGGGSSTRFRGWSFTDFTSWWVKQVRSAGTKRGSEMTPFPPVTHHPERGMTQNSNITFLTHKECPNAPTSTKQKGWNQDKTTRRVWFSARSGSVPLGIWSKV